MRQCAITVSFKSRLSISVNTVRLRPRIRHDCVTLRLRLWSSLTKHGQEVSIFTVKKWESPYHFQNWFEMKLIVLQNIAVLRRRLGQLGHEFLESIVVVFGYLGQHCHHGHLDVHGRLDLSLANVYNGSGDEERQFVVAKEQQTSSTSPNQAPDAVRSSYLQQRTMRS